ncbi:unnamed protein product [Calypogeia fissa]
MGSPEFTESTRICVKNIPRYITDDKLREHFAQKGEVTDAKIIRTRDGRTRQFGFVGFRTADEATEAVKYFHRTFFDTSRLTCEIAQQIGSQDLPQPWSRHSEGSSAFKKTHAHIEQDLASPSNTKKGAAAQPNGGKDDNAENDPELQEFLQLMQPRAKTKIWANDTITGVQETGVAQKKRKGDKPNPKGAKVEVKTVDAFARRVPINKGKTSEKLTQLHVRFEDESDSEDDNAEAEAGVILSGERKDGDYNNHAVDEEKDELVNNETVSDMQYLKSRVKENWSDDDDDEIQEEFSEEVEDEDEDGFKGTDTSTENQTEKILDAKEILPELVVDETELAPADSSGQNVGEQVTATIDAEQQENVSETGRLFVRNLPYTASEEDLTELFGKFGQLSQVHLVLDKETKHSKGFAYILFMLPEDAVRSMERLDKSIFQGRLLHILPAKRPPPAPEPKPDITGAGTTKFKTEREAQRKAAEASGDTRAWNTLFMRPDTVAENVAKRYGMTKSEFLDPEAGDLAVRMALGETHIIAETKRALSDEGVDIEVLEDIASGRTGKEKRSDCVVLVKNLPFTASEDDLISMFSAHGTLGRVILPPTKTLALVEYLEAAEARRAFKSLAYKRYQHVPLYLEWAPVNLLTAGPRPQKGGMGNVKPSTKAVGRDLVKRVELEQNLIGLPEDDVDSNVAQARSLFVKNLNFSTTRDGLKKHFEQHIKSGSIKSVTIKTKPSKNGKVLSMGFGFVEFDSKETAVEVCKQLQGTVLEGHALALQLSHSVKRVGETESSESKGGKKGARTQSSNKIIVRNVAFEATRKDLQRLFSPFGQIKSLRLPKKFDGNHRGFAFVEFMTSQESANAFDGLKSTHLYGRHLVLERAKDGESLDELRTRTAQQFFAENGIDASTDRSRKKLKTSVDNSDAAFDKMF